MFHEKSIQQCRMRSQRSGELLPSLGVRRPSVNVFKHLLLWNCKADCNQTWYGCSLFNKNCNLLLCSVFSNGRDCWRIQNPHISSVSVHDTLRNNHIKFGYNPPYSFRGEDVSLDIKKILQGVKMIRSTHPEILKKESDDPCRSYGPLFVIFLNFVVLISRSRSTERYQGQICIMTSYWVTAS
jgi:hypothetical protein